MYKSSNSIDMPGSYYWEGLDNFFHKLTAMESPRKNNDCYFYYYSTCTKGDSCTFRHEPSALGCETMCSYWQQGKCLNQHCNFRHMELRKNRKAIPCYWETQPSGCRKPHCPFQHKNPREPVNAEPAAASNDAANDQKERSDWNRRQVLDQNQYDQPAGELVNNELDCSRPAGRHISQTSTDATNFGGPTVDPLVVNFEEESDTESITTTPVKILVPQNRVKTLEEIRLERIQNETAAFYAYDPTTVPTMEKMDSAEPDLRQILKARQIRKIDNTKSDFQVLSLSEIRKRKSEKNLPEDTEPDTKVSRLNHEALTTKKSLFQIKADSTEPIKVKSLAEIRAEKAQKLMVSSTAKMEDVTSTSVSAEGIECDSNSLLCKNPQVPDLVADLVVPSRTIQTESDDLEDDSMDQDNDSVPTQSDDILNDIDAFLDEKF